MGIFVINIDFNEFWVERKGEEFWLIRDYEEHQCHLLVPPPFADMIELALERVKGNDEAMSLIEEIAHIAGLHQDETYSDLANKALLALAPQKKDQ